MARWQPNARERLVEAALDLFSEQGYENTTVIQIAERAGLTKSTFFRHFRDKREVLFGGETMPAFVAEQIAAAPADATPMRAVGYVLEALGKSAFSLERRPFVMRRQAAIAANHELQEREALKGLRLTASMTGALQQRGTQPLVAALAAELGALAWRIAYEQWSDPANTDEFGPLATRTLGELRAAQALC
jgi:AcrR family transcriptional regulator